MYLSTLGTTRLTLPYLAASLAAFADQVPVQDQQGLLFKQVSQGP